MIDKVAGIDLPERSFNLDRPFSDDVGCGDGCGADLFSFSSCVVDLNVRTIRFDLFNDRRTITDDDQRRLVWLNVSVRHSLNILYRNFLDFIPIRFQVVVRQVQHFDLHELIDESFLSLQPNRKDSRQI